MIEQAQPQHIPFIQRRLAPFKRIESEVIGRIIESPNDLVFVNPDKEVVCRIYHDSKKRQNRVAWLLPAGEKKINLFLVMAKTLVEVSHRFPEDDYFKTWARFADYRGCAIDESETAREIVMAWHNIFPESSHIKNRFKHTPWEDWIIYGNHGEIVKDIEAYLYKSGEDVKHESSPAYL